MEDIASFIGQLEGVDNAVTIRQLKLTECKISLRTDGKTLNASDVCAIHGGGGHPAAAAGAPSTAPLPRPRRPCWRPSSRCRPMANGILIIDKPAGWTSHDVVAKPGASSTKSASATPAPWTPWPPGSSPCLWAGATRAVEFAAEREKEYLAGLRLGLTTDTPGHHRHRDGHPPRDGRSGPTWRPSCPSSPGTSFRSPPCTRPSSARGRSSMN